MDTTSRNSTLSRLMAAIDRSVSDHHAGDQCLAERVCIAAALPAAVLDDEVLHLEFDRLAQIVGTDREDRLPGIGGDPPVLLVASQLRALAPRIWQVQQAGSEMRAVEIRRAMRSPRKVTWFRPSHDHQFVEQSIALGWMLKGDALFTLSRLETEVGVAALKATLDTLSESFDRRDSTEDFWHAALGYFLMARVIDRRVANGSLDQTTVTRALDAHADAVFALAHLLYSGDENNAVAELDATLPSPELYATSLEVAEAHRLLKGVSLDALALDGGDLHRIEQALDTLKLGHELAALPRDPDALLSVSGFGNSTLDSLATALSKWVQNSTD